MKKQGQKVNEYEVKVTYKLAAKPEAAKPLPSIVAGTPHSIQAAAEKYPALYATAETPKKSGKLFPTLAKVLDEYNDGDRLETHEANAMGVNAALKARAKRKAAEAQKPNQYEQTGEAWSVGPIPDALIAAGFLFARTEKKGKVTAHGYVHADGRAALFTYNGKPDSESWKLTANGSNFTGKTAQALGAKLNVTAAPVAVPKLPKGHVLSAIKLLKRDYDLSRYSDNGNASYSARMALLKKLRDTDKVLAKTNTYKALVTEFCAAIGCDETAPAFAAKAEALSKLATKTARTEKKAEDARVGKLRKAAAVIIQDDKPIITIKKKSKRQRSKEKDSLKAELAKAIRVQQEEDAKVPVTRPRPEAVVSVRANEVRLLEDPANGIAILQLEKENSQGAICVYNNGSRVAAGVIPPETLKTLRIAQIPAIVSSNEFVLQAANQLLHPVVPTVVVTPVAQRHLTAVLHCKELIPMATATVTPSKKFSPPATATKKNAKAEKPVVKAKAAAAPKAEKASAGRPATDRKIKALIKVKDIPSKEGSFCYAEILAAISHKTVSEAQAALDADKNNPTKGRKLEIAWMVKKGFINVSE